MAIERIYVSLASYILGKAVGQRNAVDAMMDFISRARRSEALTEVDYSSHVYQKHQVDYGGLKTVRTLVDFCELELHLSSGSSNLGKYRSRVLWQACQSSCDAYISVDDDVEASERTLRWLLEAIEGQEPRVVIVPCLLRESSIANVRFASDRSVRELSNGGKVVACEYGGFGLVAMNRAMLDYFSFDAVETFLDDDGKRKAKAFAPFFDSQSRWWGEDISFFRRLPFSADALVTGETVHDGQTLHLEQLL
jgi:hypothetical protein